MAEVECDKDADDRLVLHAWETLCANQNLLHAEVGTWFEPLRRAYLEPHRHYHNLHHVAECLREWQAVRASCRDADAVLAAVLFHDCVYDPTRHDNEERSAEVASRGLRALGYPQSFLDTVSGLILATRHAAVPADPDGQTLVDIDLSILGKPREEFDAYERAIRLEYAQVPDDAFRAGRARILRGFLARPSVYSTPHFREHYEQPARANLLRSLERLK